jgi:hypothetical protein
MIQIDLPEGPARPLVRGLATCLSSVTVVPLAEFPAFDMAAPNLQSYRFSTSWARPQSRFSGRSLTLQKRSATPWYGQ